MNTARKRVRERISSHLQQYITCPIHITSTETRKQETIPFKLPFNSYYLQSHVLLSGIGADEMCGGYTRYYACYDKGGYELAEKEMMNDWNRLWFRNLVLICLLD